MALAISVHEAFVAHPQAASDDIIKLIHEVECLFAALVVVVFILWLLFLMWILLVNVLQNFPAVEVQVVILLLEGQDDVAAIIAPVNILRSWANVDSSDCYLCLPVIEGNELFALDAQESSSVDSFDLEASVEYFVFLQVLVDLDVVVIA